MSSDPAGLVAALLSADRTAGLALADWLEENGKADLSRKLRRALTAELTLGEETCPYCDSYEITWDNEGRREQDAIFQDQRCDRCRGTWTTEFRPTAVYLYDEDVIDTPLPIDTDPDVHITHLYVQLEDCHTGQDFRQWVEDTRHNNKNPMQDAAREFVALTRARIKK